MGLTRVLCGQAVAVGGLVLTFVIVSQVQSQHLRLRRVAVLSKHFQTKSSVY